MVFKTKQLQLLLTVVAILTKCSDFLRRDQQTYAAEMRKLKRRL